MADQIPAVACANCERLRTPDDALDYHPLQVITNQPLGWYSGEDGEICSECMTNLIRGGRA